MFEVHTFILVYDYEEGLDEHFQLGVVLQGILYYNHIHEGKN